MFKAKVYKLGKSGRLAIMIPKDVVLEIGEYEIEVKPKTEAKQETPTELPPTSPEPLSAPTPAPTPAPAPKAEAPDFMYSIVGKYFPGAGLKAQDRGRDYAIEITIKEGDIRSFVVDKSTASIEIENWCRKIKANLEGKSLETAAGTNLMTGMKEQMKKLPPELGSDKEFFFPAE